MRFCDRCRGGRRRARTPFESLDGFDPAFREQIMAFRREAARWRAGLPHALTEEQEAALIEAREHGDSLVQALKDAGPGADVRRVVDAWCEEHGGHVLAGDPAFPGPDPEDDGDGWEEGGERGR